MKGLTLVDIDVHSKIRFVCHKTYIKINNLENFQFALPGQEIE